MKLHIIYTSALAAALLCAAPAHMAAQQDRTSTLRKAEKNGWEYEVKMGVNIGGATPLPLPREIRKIESFSPKLNGVVEADVTKWLGKDHRWGVSTGLRFEEKGMKTEAQVKNYSTEILNEGNHVKGRWTGRVETNYNATLLTLPVMANYRFNDSWKVRAGMYVSYMLDGDFQGEVSDGYLREGNPTGEKIVFENGQRSTYDFGSDLRRWLYGVQVGGTWRAFRHFSVTADLTWNLNGIFKSDFKTVSFTMYPIYLNVGFGYRF